MVVTGAILLHLSVVEMFDAAKFAEYVKSLREAHGYTLLDLAYIVGCHKSTLSRIERGHAPDIDTFLKICNWADWKAPHRCFYIEL